MFGLPSLLQQLYFLIRVKVQNIYGELEVSSLKDISMEVHLK